MDDTLYSEFLGWIIGMSLLGIGTALVYPTLLAAISYMEYPSWQATSLGFIGFGEINNLFWSNWNRVYL